MKFLEKIKKNIPIGNEPIGEINSTVDVPEEEVDEEELIEDEVLVEPEEDKENTEPKKYLNLQKKKGKRKLV